MADEALLKEEERLNRIIKSGSRKSVQIKPSTSTTSVSATTQAPAANKVLTPQNSSSRLNGAATDGTVSKSSSSTSLNETSNRRSSQINAETVKQAIEREKQLEEERKKQQEQDRLLAAKRTTSKVTDQKFLAQFESYLPKSTSSSNVSGQSSALQSLIQTAETGKSKPKDEEQQFKTKEDADNYVRELKEKRAREDEEVLLKRKKEDDLVKAKRAKEDEELAKRRQLEDEALNLKLTALNLA